MEGACDERGPCNIPLIRKESMTTYYIDKGKVQYDLEDFNVGPWDLDVHEIPSEIRFAPTSALGVEDIVLSYSYSYTGTTTSPAYKYYINLSFLNKSDIDGYIAYIKNSDYYSATKAAYASIPDYYKSIQYSSVNWQAYQDALLSAYESAGVSRSELQSYSVQLQNSPWFQKWINALTLDPTRTSIRFESSSIDPIIGAVRKAYPDAKAFTLYGDGLNIDSAGLDFVYFRNSKPGTSNTAGGREMTLSAPSSYGLAEADRITNYSSGSHGVITIDTQGFGNSTKSLRVAKNTKALAKNLKTSASFVYQQNTGYLYFNENGTLPGAGNGGIFAVIEGHPRLSTSGFQLV